MFKPVKSKKIFIEIVNQIKELIEKGYLKPGDKLPSEVELTKHFNASRASIREALAALEILGLLEGRRGDGNYIRDDIGNIPKSVFEELLVNISPFDILEARRVIEGGIIALAVQKASEEDIKELEEIIKEMPQAIENGTWNEINATFHLAIVNITDNPLLIENMRYIVEIMKEYVFWQHFENKYTQIPNLIARYYEDHILLLECIKNKDEKRGVQVMVHHIDQTTEDFLIL